MLSMFYISCLMKNYIVYNAMYFAIWKLSLPLRQFASVSNLEYSLISSSKYSFSRMCSTKMKYTFH